MEYVVDRVDTTSTVFLGLTMGCARCHNHKYDPFTQKEFYQLYAYFNSIPEDGRFSNFGNSAPWIPAPTREQQQQLAADRYGDSSRQEENSLRRCMQAEAAAAAVGEVTARASPDAAMVSHRRLWCCSRHSTRTSSLFVHDVEPADSAAKSSLTTKQSRTEKVRVGFKGGSPRIRCLASRAGGSVRRQGLV